jgi:hypothetical protein
VLFPVYIAAASDGALKFFSEAFASDLMTTFGRLQAKVFAEHLAKTPRGRFRGGVRAT